MKRWAMVFAGCLVYLLTVVPVEATVLHWNTFLGSTGNDEAYGLAVDGVGNAYVVGTSASTWGTPVRAHSGYADVFVVKLNSRSMLLWSTFLGSAEQDGGEGVAVDGSGNVYVAGFSPATWGSPVRAHGGGNDAFVAKLSATGALLWNTFLGSAGNDLARGIGVDTAGNVYVSGESAATWGSPVRAHAGSVDAFVARLSGLGALTWNTFLGASNTDYQRGFAVDGNGNSFVGGASNISWGSPVRALEGALVDGFVAKVSSAGVLQWNTFLGGTGHDETRGVAVDGAGNLHVVGHSIASWGSPVRPYSVNGAIGDTFVAGLTGAGALQWNTFLGSSAGDYPRGIAVDGFANTYVTGYSLATWGSPDRAYAGGDEAFAAKVGSAGALLWNTFLGSSASDIGYGIAVRGSGDVCVAGKADASWGNPVVAHSGSGEAFVALLKESGTKNDFGGDGKADILWRHTDGAFYLWQMNGLTAQAIGYIPSIDPSWTVTGLGDFNGDGRTDILWRHTSGQVYTWMMNGETAIDLGSPGTVDMSWSVLNAADFGGDGKADILWRHTGGAFYLWQMNGIVAHTIGYIPPIDVSWEVKALADFNGDGKSDILWRHTGGMLYLWLMDGDAASVGVGSPGSIGMDWSIVRAADFTGDGKADILWRHSSGSLAIWQMDGLTHANTGVLPVIDLSWSVSDASDFNGDGKADLLWRHTGGQAYLWLMDGWTATGTGSLGTIDPSWVVQNR